jgi:hypothetical protein
MPLPVVFMHPFGFADDLLEGLQIHRGDDAD